MRLIGLTGGIASGKSTVAAMLAGRGAAIVDADELAREVVRPSSEGLAAVVRRFGPDVLDDQGALDRGALGRLVFSDPAARAALEGITHPRIEALLETRVRAALRSPAPLVVADIPLLFERERERGLDGVLLVYAPAPVQRQRLVERGLTAAEADQRIGAQLDIEEKRARAAWVIDNSGHLEATRAAVDAWWRAVVAS